MKEEGGREHIKSALTELSKQWKFIKLFTSSWDFRIDSVVKTPSSNAGGIGSIPGKGTKVPRVTLLNQIFKKLFTDF